MLPQWTVFLPGWTTGLYFCERLRRRGRSCKPYFNYRVSNFYAVYFKLINQIGAKSLGEFPLRAPIKNTFMNYQEQWLERSSVCFCKFAADSFHLALLRHFYNIQVRNSRARPKNYRHLNQYISSSRKPPTEKNNYGKNREHKHFSLCSSRTNDPYKRQNVTWLVFKWFRLENKCRFLARREDGWTANA